MNKGHALFAIILMILVISVSLIVSPEETSEEVIEGYSSDNLVYAVQLFNCNSLILDTTGYTENGFVVIDKDVVLRDYDRIRVIDEKGIYHYAEIYEVNKENVLLSI